MKSANQNLKEKIDLKSINDPSDQQIKMMIGQCDRSPCLLCGEKPYMVGIFSPPDSSKFGASPQKVRQFFFSLCKNCVEIEGCEEMVQEVLKNISKKKAI